MYNKRDFNENEDITNYSKLTISTDTSVETDDFYGSIKVKEFRITTLFQPHQLKPL